MSSTKVLLVPLVATGVVGEMEGLELAEVTVMSMGASMATGAEALVGWAEVGSAMRSEADLAMGVGLITELALWLATGLVLAPKLVPDRVLELDLGLVLTLALVQGLVPDCDLAAGSVSLQRKGVSESHLH